MQQVKVVGEKNKCRICGEEIEYDRDVCDKCIDFVFRQDREREGK